MFSKIVSCGAELGQALFLIELSLAGAVGTEELYKLDELKLLDELIVYLIHLISSSLSSLSSLSSSS